MNTNNFKFMGIVLIFLLASLGLAGCSASNVASQIVDEIATEIAPANDTAGLQSQPQGENPQGNENAPGLAQAGQIDRPMVNPNGAALSPQGSAYSGGAMRGKAQAVGNSDTRGYGQGPGNQGVAGTGQALGPLSDAEAEALLRAIEEELGAQALYQSVIDTFGAVYPFDGIAVSEGQHADALLRLAEKYGVSVPAYTPGALPVYESIEQACQAGVTAEIADAALYDELMPSVTHTDILRVFENLKRASLENHLPSFETCQ